MEWSFATVEFVDPSGARFPHILVTQHEDQLGDLANLCIRAHDEVSLGTIAGGNYRLNSATGLSISLN
jgi:hypothetical protein